MAVQNRFHKCSLWVGWGMTISHNSRGAIGVRAPTTIGEGTTLAHYRILAGGFFDALRVKNREGGLRTGVMLMAGKEGGS
jgi:hypothetical protein